MTQRVVVAGASGFIGTRLVESYRVAGATVSTIGRRGADAVWGDAAAITALLDGADVVVNLAGKSVNCRYTDANRAEIFRSRRETTRQIADAIAACAAPPPVWINSSTATIYRHADDHPMTESGGDIGQGFSVEVAKAWESEFFAPDLPDTRRVALRIAIVLGNGSVMQPLTLLARFGLGGPQLDGRWFSTRRRREAGTYHAYRPTRGRQKFSWVHIDDVVGVVRFVSERTDIDGVINVSAPHPTDNATLMSTIRKQLGMRFGMPAYRWMLELGSAVIRTETELVLKSRWVVPERLQAEGFVFAHATIEPAIAQILAVEKPRQTR